MAEIITLLLQEETEFGMAELLAMPGLCCAGVCGLPGLLCALPGLPGCIVGSICSIPGLMCALLPSAIGGTLSEMIQGCCVL
jgi:hypothetical protein